MQTWADLQRRSVGSQFAGCNAHEPRAQMLMNTKQQNRPARASGNGRSLPAANASLIFGARPTGLKPEDQIPPNLAGYYRRLMALRDRVVKEKGDLARDAADETPTYSMDMADAATDEINRDMALSQMSAEQDALYEIDQALKRIEQGTYGICELTGQPIPEERLKALPSTRFTEEAESRLETRGVVGRPHLGKLGSVHGEATGNLEESEPGAEDAEPPPKDEVLERIFSPPGKHWHEIKKARPVKARKHTKKKARKQK